jgi:hypothetical protein
MSPVRVRATAAVVSRVRRRADLVCMTLSITRHAAARSRAHGPTAALWHAVQMHRPTAELDGACEVTLCGSLARVDTEQGWPVAARDVCPTCAQLTA